MPRRPAGEPDMGLTWIAMIASLDTSFGMPKVTVARHPAHLSCKKTGKARTFTPDRKPSAVSRLMWIG